MKIHFPTREKARKYAKLGSKIIDNGKLAPVGKRWQCEAVIVPRGTDSKPDSVSRGTSFKKKIVVIINADKTASDENITQCFEQALHKWKDENKAVKLNRHTAKAELNALFK